MYVKKEKVISTSVSWRNFIWATTKYVCLGLGQKTFSSSILYFDAAFAVQVMPDKLRNSALESKPRTAPNMAHLYVLFDSLTFNKF